MITKYEKFINEELKSVFGDDINTNKGLLGAFKNLFGKLLQNISDELKKPVEDLTNKLDKSKKKEDTIKYINDFLRIHNENLTKSLNNSNDIESIVKIVKDNLTSVYAAIDAGLKTLGEKYTFEEMFGQSPKQIQKLFNSNEKNFNKNVDNFTNELILSLGKQYGFTKEDIIKENFNLINEADEADEQLTDEQQKQEIENAENDQENQEPKVDKQKEQKIKNLKDAILKWFQNFIYKNIQDDLKKDKGGNEGEQSLQDKINNMKSTDKKDSVNKIFNKLTEVDKNTLIKVRDLLGLTKDDSPL